jgi:hypothetical protein
MAPRILPQADSNSTTHSTGPVVGEVSNSRNAGAGRGGWAAGGNRFFNRV